MRKEHRTILPRLKLARGRAVPADQIRYVETGNGAVDDGQVLGMNFYVKGIDDKIPGK